MNDPIKIERFRRALDQSEFDVVLAVSPENSWYLSEAVIDTQVSLLERLAVVVWAKGKDKPIYIVCTNEEVQARRDSWIEDIRGYVEFITSPMELAAQALGELGASDARVGIEKRFLQAHYYEELRSLAPKAELVEASGFFDKVRAIKTPSEIRRLEQAALATDRAIRKSFEAARPGMTEKQIGIALSSELILNGAEGPVFQVLGAGQNTRVIHNRASDYVIQDGDLMRTDFGGLFAGGYKSDLGRTVVVGKPHQRQVDTYRFIHDELERLISMMRPGVTFAELYNTHKKHWEEHGWPMVRPHIGHNLGIGIHEHPLMRPGDRSPIEVGMCLAVEPAQTLPDVERYHMEDLIEVTEGGPRVLSRSADWSQLFAAGT